MKEFQGRGNEDGSVTAKRQVYRALAAVFAAPTSDIILA
jgi:hypothetical protein